MSGSGPGGAGQHDYSNPANFFNGPPQQQDGSGHEFFDQQHQGGPSQQQNWFQQQPGPPPPGGDMTNSQPSTVAAPVFYNPSDYTKGAQPPAPFNPFPQEDPNQQQQQLQQPEGTPQNDNSSNQWYQHQNPADQTHPQEWNNPDPTRSQEWNHPQQSDPQQSDQNHGYGGANPYNQMEGHAPDPTYNQQPFYSSQQSNDSTTAPDQQMQGNVDHRGAPNHWDQPPTNVARESAAEGAWNNPNPMNPVANNSIGSVGNVEQDVSAAQGNGDEDDGGGYLGFFHNDDNESDFAESDRTESAEDTNQQAPSAAAAPSSSSSRTFDENNASLPQNVPSSLPEGVAPVGQIPAVEQNQYPYSQPYQPEGQEFVPNDNAQSAPPQPFQPQGDIPQADHYLQNQFYPPSSQSNLSDTRPDAEPELQMENHHGEAGYEAGPPPSEHSSMSGSLPPSDPSGGSASTSRSNSLLGEGGTGSAASSSIGISSSSSHENAPVVEPIPEQIGNSAPSGDRSLPHSGQVDQSVCQQPPPIGHQHHPYPQGFAPPTDMSRQNSAMSDASNSGISVPSAVDISRTGGGSLLAESEQQFDQEMVATTQSIPYEPSGGATAAHGQHPPPISQTIPVNTNTVLKQDIPQIPPVTHVNTVPGNQHGSIPQPNQHSALGTSDFPANPQHSSVNPLNQFTPTNLTSNAPVKVSASPASTHPQGSQPVSPMLETNPLLSGTSHPSAFHKVKGHQTQSPVPVSAAVNPSPPLWSTEVPPLPSNILLAPAAPSSNAPRLAAPSPQPTQPIKLDGNLAASIANVSVPPPPTLPGNNPTMPPTITQGSSVPNVSGQNVPNVQQVTQNLAGLTMGPSPQPVLMPPASVTTPAVTAPPASMGPPPVPVQSVQSLPSLSQSSGSAGQIAIAASPSAPNISAHGSPTKQPAVTVLTSEQTPSTSQAATAPLTSMAQNTGQYTQQGPGMQQQYGHNQQQQFQAPPGQEQWYGQTGQQQHYPYNAQYPYQQQQQQYHQDYRSQYEYDPYHRPYPKQQHYRDQQRPYSRQGYESQERASYRDRDPARSSSRQGYEDGSSRGSRRTGYEYGDGYYRGYSKRDPRYRDWADYDAYRRSHGHHRGSYDPRYEEYNRNKEYQAKWNRGHEQQHSGGGGMHVSKSDTSLDHTLDQSVGATESNQERSFSKEFHHTGGDTPDKYGPDQSVIAADSSGYDEQQQQQYDNNRRGYGGYGNGQYDNSNSRSHYDNGYGSTDGSWNQYQYGGYGATDGSYVQEPPKPATPPPPQRLTPARFNRPHVGARFSSGGHLIKILPNNPIDGQPAIVEIHSIETMLEHREEYTDLKAFPGPLIRNDTHKNDVVRFSLQKADECRKSDKIYDKHSAALLWDLMVLLCRQNGTIVGTDISELLLRDHEMTKPLAVSPPPAPPAEAVATTGEDTEADAEIKEGATEAPPKTVVIAQRPKKKAGPDIEAETHRFRELLLFGRKKEALDSAIKGGLWGHALLLACKMDHRTHLSVMTRFANSLPMNDPLQTLYQLMSNRQPAAVTSCSDEKWGDWRPHLAMIISNLISNTDLDVKSITSLGDSLAVRQLLHASHFCYLMAQIGLGHYSKKSTKMVLLGAQHSLPFDEFARQTPIQQTEVYEYAQSLNNKKYFLPTFQVYKFIYATHLLDFGLVTQALHYCEVIATKIQYYPSYFSPTIISQVSELSHRLKYHDPQYFDGREVTDPDWLRELDHIKIQYEEGAIQPSSATDTPMPWVESSSNLSTMGEGSVSSEGMSFEVSRTNAAAGQPPRMTGTPMSDDYGMVPTMEQQQQQQDQYGSQQQQYGEESQQQQYGEGSQQGQQQYGEGGQQHGQQQQYGDGSQQYGSEVQQDQQQQHYGGSEQSPEGYGEGQQQTGPYTLDQSGYYQPTDPNANPDYQGGGQQTDQQQPAQGGYDWGNQQQYPEMGTEAISQQGGATDVGYQQGGNYAQFGTQPAPTDNNKPQNLDLTASQGSNFSEYSTTSAATTNDGWATDSDQPDSGPPATQALDYYGQSTKMGNNYGGPPSPVRTLTPPDTPITRTRTRTLSENSQTRETPQPQKSPPKQEKPKQKKDDNKSNKKKGGWLSGWFGGGKKDMHLPDDKDKQIQWDATKNRWVNTADGEDEDSGAPPPPPPTDHELSGGPVSQTPSANGPPGGPGQQSVGPPPPGVNKFSRKTAGRGKNYVDIFNQGSTMAAKPSSMPPPSKIFDTLPSSNAMPMNFFVPQGGNVSGDEGSTGQQIGNPDSRAETPATPRSRQNSGAPAQQQNQQAPQFFNPNAFSGGASQQEANQQPQGGIQQPMQQLQQQEENLSRSSSMSSLSQEVSQHMNNQSVNSSWQQEEPPAPAAAPPLTQPMMFDPSQFAQPSFTPQSSNKRGYGARRQYPSKR